MAEHSNGKVKVTKDTDRKPIVLARVRRYLRTGQVGQPTRISAQIVRSARPELHRDQESLAQADLASALGVAGCDRDSIVITSVAADRPARRYHGLMFASARKERNPRFR